MRAVSTKSAIILDDTVTPSARTPISKPVYVPPVEKEPVVTVKTVTGKPVTVKEPAIIFSNSQVKTVERPPELQQRARDITEVQNIASTETPKEDMTAFGKTIVGKILKGAAIAGGSILGLGAVTGVVKGVGVAAGIGKALTTSKTVIDKVGASAVNLITGTSKEEREQVREIKAEAKDAADKLEQMNRLIKAGASTAQARAMAGVAEPELTEYEGKPITTAGIGDFFAANKKILMIVGGLLAAFLFLPRILKKR